ncbi:MAG: hypothetical protein HQM08_17315 [Candidatus Riflebacteria bacterium]|nr:hypothetical protein [Candidatus Riflebacteria bacterium]
MPTTNQHSSSNSLVPVAFDGDTLFIADHNGEPFTPLKPICEALGLSWKRQLEKLSSDRERRGVHLMYTTSPSGIQKTLCISVRKLPAFLYSINVLKIKPEFRAKLERYQTECDDALWNFWSKGFASRSVSEQAQNVLPLIQQAQTELKTLASQVDILKANLLKNNPLWEKIYKCRQAGLTRDEITRVIKRGRSAIDRSVKKMVACGLIKFEKGGKKLPFAKSFQPSLPLFDADSVSNLTGREQSSRQFQMEAFQNIFE